MSSIYFNPTELTSRWPELIYSHQSSSLLCNCMSQSHIFVQPSFISMAAEPLTFRPQCFMLKLKHFNNNNNNNNKYLIKLFFNYFINLIPRCFNDESCVTVPDTDGYVMVLQPEEPKISLSGIDHFARSAAEFESQEGVMLFPELRIVSTITREVEADAEATEEADDDPTGKRDRGWCHWDCRRSRSVWPTSLRIICVFTSYWAQSQSGICCFCSAYVTILPARVGVHLLSPGDYVMRMKGLDRERREKENRERKISCLLPDGRGRLTSHAIC